MRINLFTQQSVAHLAASTAAQNTTVISTSQKLGQAAKDATVNLSIDGVTRSQAANLYSQYYPTREGFSADALALSTVLPQSTSSSTGLYGEAIGQDARKRLDAVYAAMAASGSPYSADSDENVDDNTLFGGLDRRSLLAVANNDGNQFTKDEQAKARGIMDQQQSLASGLYSGPIRLESTFTSVKDYSTVMALTASFLDNVSDEEKQTATWRNQRARTLGVAPANNQDTLNDSLAKLMVLVGSGSSPQ